MKKKIASWSFYIWTEYELKKNTKVDPYDSFSRNKKQVSSVEKQNNGVIHSFRMYGILFMSNRLPCTMYIVQSLDQKLTGQNITSVQIRVIDNNNKKKQYTFRDHFTVIMLNNKN